MAFKIFLDANFLLDLTLKRSAFPEVSQVMQAAINRDIEAFTTPAVLHITAYFLTKEYGAATAKQIITTLLNDVTIIDSNHATTTLALQSNIEDVEDALNYFAALAAHMDYFISADADLKKRVLTQLPVCTAKELIPLLV